MLGIFNRNCKTGVCLELSYCRNPVCYWYARHQTQESPDLYISCVFYDMIVPFFWILIMGVYICVACLNRNQNQSNYEAHSLLDTEQPLGKHTKLMKSFD